MTLEELTNGVQKSNPDVTAEQVADVFGEEDINSNEVLETGEICTLIRIGNAINAGNDYSPVSDEDYQTIVVDYYLNDSDFDGQISLDEFLVDVDAKEV